MSRTQNLDSLEPTFDGSYWHCPKLTDEEEWWLEKIQPYVYEGYCRKDPDLRKVYEAWDRVKRALQSMS